MLSPSSILSVLSLRSDFVIKELGQFRGWIADKYGFPEVVENCAKDWNHGPEEWKLRSMHGSYAIAYGINHAIQLIE
jgi:hypothetical protein